MNYAKIKDYFVNENAVFYLVSGKLDLAPILHSKLNKAETLEEAVARWNIEQHWLADWNHREPFEGYQPDCEVSFEISSSTFYPTMHHNGKTLKNVRNINVLKIRKVG